MLSVPAAGMLGFIDAVHTLRPAGRYATRSYAKGRMTKMHAKPFMLYSTLETLESRQLLSSTSLNFNVAAGGLDQTGFTGVLATSKGHGNIANNISLGNGVFRVTTTAGTFANKQNSQDDAFDVAVDASKNFTVETRLLNLALKKNGQAGGLFVGTDQDNYVKLVASYSAGTGVQLGSETAGAFKSLAFKKLSLATFRSLDVRLVGTVSNHLVKAYYRVNSASTSKWVFAGQTTNAAIFKSTAKAGIVTTNAGTTTPVIVRFDSFSVSNGPTSPPTHTSPPPPSTSPPPPPTASGLKLHAPVNATHYTGNQSENVVAINPTNPNNIVVISSDGGTGGSAMTISRSMDGGASFSTYLFGGNQDGFSTKTIREDPHVAFDDFGNCYIAYIVGISNNEVKLIVGQSSDGGASFKTTVAAGGDGVIADGVNMTAGIDGANKSHQAVYVTYTDYGVNRVRVAHASSTGLGQLGGFSINTLSSNANGNESSVAVGPDGEVAVVWQNPDAGKGPSTLYISTSVGGGGFSAQRTIGRTAAGGFTLIPAEPDRGFDAEAHVAFDRSNGPMRGRLYLVYVDNVAGGNDFDIVSRFSDDLGFSWSNSVFVNDDTGSASQFDPALAVDPKTGNVGISWYDARNSPNNTTVEEFAAISKNHGASYLANVQVAAGLSSQGPSNTANGGQGDQDFGDYSGLAFYNGKLIPSWVDNTNSTHNNPNGAGSLFDIYTAVLTVI